MIVNQSSRSRGARLRALRLTLPALCLVALAAARHELRAAPPSRYTVTNVGVLPGSEMSESVGVNKAGQAAVTLAEGERTRAALWNGSALVRLGDLPGADSTVAHAISPGGAQVVGIGEDADGKVMVPFSWKAGTYTLLPLLPGGTTGDARATNGTITVGSSRGRDGGVHAVRWTAAGVEALEALPEGLGSEALGVNAAGDAVGWAADAEGQRTAVLWRVGKLRSLGALPGDKESRAVVINAAGQVAGTSQGPEGRDRAFLWRDNQLQALPGLGGDESVAIGINAAGVVIGMAELANGEDWHACMWVDGRAIDLNTLLAPGSGWVLDEANDINDAGQIAGTGVTGDKVRGFVLTPQPEPAAPPSAPTPVSAPAGDAFAPRAIYFR